MKAEAMAPGLCPRAEELVRLTRAAELGTARVPRRELELAFLAQAEEFISLQKGYGFAYISDGQLKWKDPFRPLLLSMRNVAPGPLTRWLETNTFFRAPLVSSLPKPKPGILPRYTHSRLVQERYVLEVPGPFTFAACSIREGAVDAGGLMLAYCSALSSLLSSPSLRGLELVCLNEPYMALASPSERQLEVWRDALKRLEGFRLLVGFDMVDASQLLPSLARIMPEEWLFKVDLTRTPLEALSMLRSRRYMGLGVADVDTSLLEDGAQLARFLGPRIRELGAEELYVMPSADLRFVPYELAKEKLKVLRAAADELLRLS